MLYRKLGDLGVEVLYDDRDERAGAKFASADLIGIPWHIIIGRDTIENGTYELKNRRTDERVHLTLEDVLQKFR